MLIDAHSHIDRYELVDEETLDAALTDISEYGIFTVSNSMDLPSYERNLAVAERCRTDNPGGPKGFIGDHGMPSLIKDVVRALAELRGVSAETIVQTVKTNFETLIQDAPMLASRCTRTLDDQYHSI